MKLFLFSFKGMYCKDVTYLDYTTNQNYDYIIEASSASESAANAMKGSGSNWVSTVLDSAADGEVWIKFILNMETEQNAEAAIRDIWLNVEDASQVRLQYSFRELPSAVDIEIPPAQVAINQIHIDVAAVGIQTGLNVTAVKIIIEPAFVGASPSVSNLAAQVCYNPQESE